MVIGFPALGELIKYAFNATGVVPSKRGNYHGLNDADKKKIQKSLERISSEEGSLNDKCGELISTLVWIVSTGIKSQRVLMVMGDIAIDLFEVYRSVVKSDGSYMEKSETVRWFVSTYVVPRLVLSVNKHLLRYNIKAENLIVPNEEFWFLPTINENEIVWPLEKTMSWIYGLSGKSQTKFHYPEKSSSSDCFVKSQNLENAQNWFSGKHLPSWEGLLQNFSHSMDCHSAECPHLAEKKESILVALFVARLATYVAQDIFDNYGVDYLSEIIDQYKRHSHWIGDCIVELTVAVTKFVKSSDCHSEDEDGLWLDFSDHYWQYFADKSEYSVRHIESVLQQNYYNSSQCDKDYFIQKYGEFAVSPVFEFLARQEEVRVPDGFAECLNYFFDLKKDFALGDNEANEFRRSLEKNNMLETLSWTEPWLRAIIRYRKDDFFGAYSHFKDAFENAKYSAGKNQYQLMNQYLESCAKNNKWREFKKGIDWAQYLGIEVRWLRQDEPTEEKLRNVFELMKIARYAQL